MLNKLATHPTPVERLLLIILDGVGLYAGEKEGYPGNALDQAKAPVLKGLLASAPVSASIKAHGTAVGLPSDDDMGNSEVGHNAMGAGRIFDQGAKLVANAIADGSLFSGNTWQELIGSQSRPGVALKNQKAVHFLGLLSDGNVHSHIDHLFAMLDECARAGVPRVFVHTLLDGRDVPKQSADKYVQALEAKLKSLGENFRIASGGGRMQITMDRYNADWSMVERGWATHVRGEGRGFTSASEAIAKLRSENPDVIDQDLPPFVITENGKAIGPIQEGDVVICFNFRGDRAIEISRAFAEENFSVFKRDPSIKVHYAGMMEYDGDLKIPPRYLVSPPAIDRTLSEYLVASAVPQYAISETQKFGHVTYFWNGNNSEKFDNGLETWEEIPSDVISFDQKPRMKADEITTALIKAMQSKRYRFARVNFANGDMVGHTGNLPAAIQSMEAVDENLKRLLEAANNSGYTVIVTADHGNCDQMIEVDKNGRPQRDADGRFAAKTSHTLSPVPFVLTGPNAEHFQFNNSLPSPGLGNLAGTVLHLLGLEPPEDYLPSLLEKAS